MCRRLILLLGSLLTLVSAAVCCSVVGSSGLYSPGFISRSGREPVLVSASKARVGGLSASTHLFKSLPFVFKHSMMPNLFTSL